MGRHHFSFSAPNGQPHVVNPNPQEKTLKNKLNNKILIAASVGLSLFAAAQRQTDTQKPKPSTTQTQSPRDLASAQPSGRSADQRAKDSAGVHRELAAREVATRHASGKNTTHHDQHLQL